MTAIIKANTEHCQLLCDIGKISFIESHGHSAAPGDISTYVKEKYSEESFKEEIADAKNIYHIIYHHGQPAGYSKIIFDATHPDIAKKNVTKMERLYLLKEFYNLKLGYDLLKFNIDLSKTNHQSGIWLYVWKENPRAVSFYKKNGFVITGSHDFKLTETHSNPNHQMFLSY
jgi:ribosomal protein S18 acetylase RimI-like enzyme